MHEIVLTSPSKEGIYKELIPQITSLIEDERNLIANMANIAAALHHSFDYYSWVGFYLYDEMRKDLIVGPFQGKIACTRIAVGKGVCGTSFQHRKTIIVPDVNKFPGHIFCDGDSKSEIVVPLIVNDSCIGVLDVDSYSLNSFDHTDQTYLEEIASMITKYFTL